MPETGSAFILRCVEGGGASIEPTLPSLRPAASLPHGHPPPYPLAGPEDLLALVIEI